MVVRKLPFRHRPFPVGHITMAECIEEITCDFYGHGMSPCFAVEPRMPSFLLRVRQPSFGDDAVARSPSSSKRTLNY